MIGWLTRGRKWQHKRDAECGREHVNRQDKIVPFCVHCWQMVAVGGILATRFNTPLVVPFICGCWSCSDPPHPEWAGSCPTIGFFTWAALVGWERVGLTQKPLQSEATRCCCCCCCCCYYCCCCCCCNFAFDMPVVIQKAILFPFFLSNISD